MTHARTALLSDRSVVRVAGADAEKLLQGIITGDMDLLGGQSAIYAALLTPQGKILFEFFVIRHGDEFLLEVAKDQAAGLAKRLALYKLRAQVDIRDCQDAFQVSAIWDGTLQSRGEAARTVSFSDPRLPELGQRILTETGSATDDAGGNAQDYHSHRISLGVPEGGKDYVFGDTFPHEANLDLLNGVSFSKGCFVGQEVVSRMQHRGTARKRIVIAKGEAPLQTGTEVAAGKATIGTIGSVAGTRGLAIVRLDRVEDARRKGEQITAADMAITISLPGYMNPAIPADTP